MSVAACLMLYSIAVALGGPPVLRRLTRNGDAPRVGVAAWLTAIASVLISWAVAPMLVVVDVARGNHDGFLVASCVAHLRDVVTGHAGAMAQIAFAALAIAAVVTAMIIAVRLARTVSRLRARAHEHAHAVRLVGRQASEHDVVILDAAEPAAYCVGGSPPAIVVTTGALAALDDGQMGAVLAHERAHLAGHHPDIVVALRSLASVFPRLTLMTDGAADVSRLLEMRADDAAARRCGRETLLSGLIALVGVAPAGALGAADVALLARAGRLAAPQAQLARARAGAVLIGAVAILVAGPLITAVLAATGSMCGP